MIYAANPADTEEELDMVLRSKGVDVVYGQMPEHDVLVTYYDHLAIGMERWDTPGMTTISLRRLALFSNFEKVRATLKSHAGFHIGVMAGRSTFDRRFADAVAAKLPEGFKLFFTKLPEDSEVLSLPAIAEAVARNNAIACQHKAGVIHKYLAMLDVLLVPEKSPDRLMSEAQASAIPIIISNDAQHALETANSLHKDRKQFRDARAAAVDVAAKNDLAYEIITFKERLKSVLQWSTSG